MIHTYNENYGENGIDGKRNSERLSVTKTIVETWNLNVQLVLVIANFMSCSPFYVL